MSKRTFPCLHCGLALTVESAKGGAMQFTYDYADWRRRCRHPALDSPALCLLEQDGGIGSPLPPEPDDSGSNAMH